MPPVYLYTGLTGIGFAFSPVALFQAVTQCNRQVEYLKRERDARLAYIKRVYEYDHKETDEWYINERKRILKEKRGTELLKALKDLHALYYKDKLRINKTYLESRETILKNFNSKIREEYTRCIRQKMGLR